MIGYRIRRFLDGWAASGPAMRAFLLWNAANTVLAFALVVSSIPLLSVLNAPGFQRSLLLGYIGLAVAWALSVFLIGPVYERVDPAVPE